MKSILLTALSLSVCAMGRSQNLVPNGDLELYTTCQTSEAQLYLAAPWVSPTTNTPGISGTPDYFNACMAPGGIMDVPDNLVGHQPAHSGVGYAGVFIYQQPFVDIREYVEVPLISTLIPNQCYSFSMFMALGDLCQYTDDDIGVYFSSTLISGVNNMTVLPYVPQLNNAAGNYPDTAGWTLMTGEYTAAGGEGFMVIGSFVNDAAAAPVQAYPGSDQPWTFVFFDDVSLTPCGTSGIVPHHGPVVEVHPNLVTDELDIEVDDPGPLQFTLFDPAARPVISQRFSGRTRLDLRQLPAGMYLYQIAAQGGVIDQGKIIKD